MTTHSEKRVLAHKPEQLFDLVADVQRYPEFLPWTAAARIRKTEQNEDHVVVLADLVISFKVFRERFGSKVRLEPESLRIDTEYLDGPFKHMISHWHISPDPGGALVDFSVDFEMKNAILGKAVGLVFDEAMRRIVGAFEARATELYG